MLLLLLPAMCILTNSTGDIFDSPGFGVAQLQFYSYLGSCLYIYRVGVFVIYHHMGGNLAGRYFGGIVQLRKLDLQIETIFICYPPFKYAMNLLTMFTFSSGYHGRNLRRLFISYLPAVD